MPTFSFYFFLILTFLSFTGCSAQRFYIASMETERRDADLDLKKMTLNFGELVYLENSVNDSTAVVLLHGFGGDKDNWNRFSLSLDKYHLIVPDLPGHGKSVATENLGYSLKHQAEMLNVFLAAKNIKMVHLVGNSMGGAIALRYAGQYPDKVKSLVLIDALGMIKTKSEIVQIFEQTGKNPFFNICTRKAFRNFLNLSMQQPPYIPDFVLDVLVLEKCRRAELEKIIFNEMVKDYDLAQIANKITIPTLIIWGKKDRIIHIDSAHLFHSTIKNSQLVIYDELGHVPLLEAPAKTARSVDKFLKNIH